MWDDAPLDQSYQSLLDASQYGGNVAGLDAFEQGLATGSAALPPVEYDDIDYSRVQAQVLDGGNQQEDREHLAAQRIQARIRGAQTRKQAQQPGGLSPSADDHRAAAAIQARYRGSQTRKQQQMPGGLAPSDEHHAAASAIQARIRGRQTRSKRGSPKGGGGGGGGGRGGGGGGGGGGQTIEGEPITVKLLVQVFDGLMRQKIEPHIVRLNQTIAVMGDEILRLRDQVAVLGGDPGGPASGGGGGYEGGDEVSVGGSQGVPSPPQRGSPAKRGGRGGRVRQQQQAAQRRGKMAAAQYAPPPLQLGNSDAFSFLPRAAPTPSVANKRLERVRKSPGGQWWLDLTADSENGMGKVHKGLTDNAALYVTTDVFSFLDILKFMYSSFKNPKRKDKKIHTISGLHQQGTLKLYGRLDVLQPMEFWVLKKAVEHCCGNEPGTESPYVFNGHDDGLEKFFAEYQKWLRKEAASGGGTAVGMSGAGRYGQGQMENWPPALVHGQVVVKKVSAIVQFNILPGTRRTFEARKKKKKAPSGDEGGPKVGEAC